MPGVDGALVTFKLRPPSRRQPLAGGEAGFRALVAKAFSERRKMMRNNLQPLYSPKQVRGAAQGDARARARGTASTPHCSRAHARACCCVWCG